MIMDLGFQLIMAVPLISKRIIMFTTQKTQAGDHQPVLLIIPDPLQIFQSMLILEVINLTFLAIITTPAHLRM